MIDGALPGMLDEMLIRAGKMSESAGCTSPVKPPFEEQSTRPAGGALVRAPE
jgi:hypothetical protein